LANPAFAVTLPATGTNHRQFATVQEFVALVKGFELTARRAHRRMEEVLCFSNQFGYGILRVTVFLWHHSEVGVP